MEFELYSNENENQKEVNGFLLNDSKLNFAQKRIVSAYELFYSKKIDLRDQQCFDEVQAMCYLLKIHNVELESFGFSLNYNGPYSPLLLSYLLNLKNNVFEVIKFNEENIDKNEILGDNNNKLIPQISQKLKIYDYKDDKKWTKTLSALAYISITLVPLEDFDTIVRYYNYNSAEPCTFENKKYFYSAYKTLFDADIIPKHKMIKKEENLKGISKTKKYK